MGTSACSVTLLTDSNFDPDPGRANNTSGPGAAMSLKVNRVPGVLREPPPWVCLFEVNDRHERRHTHLVAIPLRVNPWGSFSPRGAYMATSGSAEGPPAKSKIQVGQSHNSILLSAGFGPS